MIRSTLKQLFSLFQSPPRTDTKVFASILLPELCSNTDAFLTLYRSGVFQTSSPLSAMSRFAVKSITHHDTTNVGLEDEHLGYLSVRVEDVEQRKPYDFIIERTHTGSSDNRISSESRILKMPMDKMPSPSPYLSLIPDLSPSPSKSPHSRLESASRTSVQGAHSLARSREYVDMILGAGYMRKMRYRSTRVVRKVTSSKLTLFDLVLLTDVVHNVAAMHFLFENHCYWFMKIICDAIVALSDGDYTNDDQDRDINNQPYQPPPNRPLSPHLLSGTWNLVSDVRDKVLVDVLSNFLERRNEEIAKIQRREQENFEASYRDDEMQRTTIKREAEIRGLQSDMTNLQGEMVDLLNKLHKFESGNLNVNSSSSNSAGHAQPASASIR